MKISIGAKCLILMAASSMLSGCTASGDSEVEKTEVTPPATPSATSAGGKAAFAQSHQQFLARYGEPTQIISQVESTGPATLQVGDLPANFDSVGFMISCTGFSDWEIDFSSGYSIGGSSCGDDAKDSVASVSIPIDQLNEETVRLSIKEGIDVLATVFATNEPE